jgi:uncharacterized protein YoxC
VNWADVLRAAGAFALVLVSLTLSFVLVRLAATLQRTNELLSALDREAVSAVVRVNSLLDQASGELTKVDTLLDTAVSGAEAADRTVRRVAAAVERPVSRLSEAAAFVRGAASSFVARRQDRAGGGERS